LNQIDLNKVSAVHGFLSHLEKYAIIWINVSNFLRKGMMKDGAESIGSVLFIVRFYGVIERLPVMG
jgi:hypothetical protein